eukprot:gene56777-biopygen95133
MTITEPSAADCSSSLPPPDPASRHPKPMERRATALDAWTDFQAWVSDTMWCGAGTDIVNTECPGANSGDLQADRACRRHDHGAKANGIIGDKACRLGCDIDADLASATGN